MKVRTLRPFDQAYAILPEVIQKKTAKQIRFLVANLRHPSLRVKKYNEADDIWQARIDRSYRFYFKVDGDTYVLTELIKHKD